MANTFELVGSPLGLFTLRSRPTRDGMSSFNGGKSRNVNVIAYNTGKKQVTNIKKSDGSNVSSPVSLFSGGALPNFWPNIKTSGTDLDPTGLSASPYNGFQRSDLHNNDVYDTSLLNIIEKLSFSKMAAVRPQDFAYLKNLGVLPNNRLMIARRFLSPSKDNIMGKSGTPPSSILISWKPEGEDFLEITYGEEWVDAEADFSNILNKIGEDFNIKGAGGGAGKGANILPLPGFTEGLQREVLIQMGILKKTDGDVPLPSGNPNIIKMAKRRKTIGYGQAGSGLKFDVSIKMLVEYEQKFISGIDPTIAWMDIMNNALIFGTSKSNNYGLSPEFVSKLNLYTSNPGKLIDDIITGIQNGLTSFLNELDKVVQEAKAAFQPKPAEPKETPSNDEQTAENDKLIDNAAQVVRDLANKFLGSIKESIMKYKVELMGIANALSGSPSAPWHITVGNPLRPVFCSGDMLPGDIKLTLGSTLAFNDLPSNIKIDFTLKNARPLGLQEILSKFNTGHLRTINIQKSYLEVDTGAPGEVYTDNSIADVPTPPAPPAAVDTPPATPPVDTPPTGATATPPDAGATPPVDPPPGTTTTKEGDT